MGSRAWKAAVRYQPSTQAPTGASRTSSPVVEKGLAGNKKNASCHSTAKGSSTDRWPRLRWRCAVDAWTESPPIERRADANGARRHDAHRVAGAKGASHLGGRTRGTKDPVSWPRGFQSGRKARGTHTPTRSAATRVLVLHRCSRASSAMLMKKHTHTLLPPQQSGTFGRSGVAALGGVGGGFRADATPPRARCVA